MSKEVRGVKEALQSGRLIYHKGYKCNHDNSFETQFKAPTTEQDKESGCGTYPGSSDFNYYPDREI